MMKDGAAPWPRSHGVRPVVAIGRLRLRGFAAWLPWLVVHVALMTGFKNRAAALANWAVAFIDEAGASARSPRCDRPVTGFLVEVREHDVRALPGRARAQGETRYR
jgi:hypothetical protein